MVPSARCPLAGFPAGPARAAAMCLAGCLGLGAGSTPAAEPPAAVTAEFARKVQPLLINSCAAGACHGGPASPAPRLERIAGGIPADGRITRTNLQAFLDSLGPSRDLQPLLARLAGRHPVSAAPGGLLARPFSPAQRITIENWLVRVRTDERRAQNAVSGGLDGRPAAGPAGPNRFRALLDAAAHPPNLPPPERPRGIIFGPVDPPPDE